MEISSDQSIPIIIGIVAVLLILFLIILGAIYNNEATKSAFNDSLEANIDKEITNFFLEKNLQYEFRNSELENILRHRLKAAMIDQRTNGFKYKKAYLNRTTTKDKEIHSIINKYYKLDQKGKVYDIHVNKKDSSKSVEFVECSE